MPRKAPPKAFKPGQNNPRTSRNKKTLIMEAMREQAVLGLSENASKEDCEKAWFGLLTKTAIDSEDRNSGMAMKLLTERGWAAIKATSELIEFDFDEDASPVDKANQVLKAVSEARIPLEYGVQLVAAIKATIEIELSTEIKDRIEDIESKLGIDA